MNFQAIINSPGIWIVSAFLVIISVSQAVVFMRAALKEATECGINKEKKAAAIRSYRRQMFLTGSDSYSAIYHHYKR